MLSILMFIGHLFIFFGGIFIQVLSIFLIKLFILLSSLCFMDTLYIWFAKFSPILQNALITLLTVYFDVLKF